jgi:hypothetical protein
MPQVIVIGGTEVTVYTIPDFDSDPNIQDTDSFGYWDATSNSMKEITWENIKDALAVIHYSKTEVNDLIASSVSPEGVRDNGATLAITTAKPYVFYGSTAVWTMPVGAGVIWQKFYLANDGTGNVIIKNYGGSQIFELYPGTRVVAFYDGVNWIFIG